MELDARAHAYRRQTGRKQLTRQQWRRFKKKAWRDEQRHSHEVLAVEAEMGYDPKKLRPAPEKRVDATVR